MTRGRTRGESGDAVANAVAAAAASSGNWGSVMLLSEAEGMGCDTDLWSRLGDREDGKWGAVVPAPEPGLAINEPRVDAEDKLPTTGVANMLDEDRMPFASNEGVDFVREFLAGRAFG